MKYMYYPNDYVMKYFFNHEKNQKHSQENKLNNE